jgi:four helix bundle protein
MQNADCDNPGQRWDALAQRLMDFAARVGKVCDALPDTRLGKHIAGQMIRSGTSPAPNYAEARGAESRRDFIHKLSICLKELRETECWIQLIIRAELLPVSDMNPLLDECDQLIRILVRSVLTAKQRTSTVKSEY